MVTMTDAAPRHSGLWFALLAVVLWLPLPLGSNRPWSVALLVLLSFTLLGLWATRYAFAPYPLPAAVRTARPALLWGLAWIAYGALQTVPLPSTWTTALSPHSAQLYQQGLAALHLPPAAWLPLSVDVAATAHMTYQMAAYLSLFTLVLLLADNSRRIRVLAITLLTAAAVNTLYGLIVAFDGAQSVWRITPYLGHNMVSGTYINRNHFAGLMLLTLPLGLGLLFAQRLPFAATNSWRSTLADWSEFLLSPASSILLLCLLALLGLVFSNSRGGLLALGLALCLLTLHMSYRAQGRHHAALLLGSLILMGAGLAWLGDSGLGERLSQQGFSDTQRPLLWADTLRYSSDYWLFGSGAGTFRWTFPAYKSAALGTALFEHAHNDYLETLAESGLIGGSLLLGFSLTVLRSLLRTPRHPAAARYLVLAVITASGALLLHGLVDFNLRIPANAAYFYLVLALGLAASKAHASNRNHNVTPD